MWKHEKNGQFALWDDRALQRQQTTRAVDSQTALTVSQSLPTAAIQDMQNAPISLMRTA